MQHFISLSAVTVRRRVLQIPRRGGVLVSTVVRDGGACVHPDVPRATCLCLLVAIFTTLYAGFGFLSSVCHSCLFRNLQVVDEPKTKAGTIMFAVDIKCNPYICEPGHNTDVSDLVESKTETCPAETEGHGHGTKDSLYSKFEGGFFGTFASLSAFYGGVEGLLGAGPQANMVAAMRHEHTEIESGFGVSDYVFRTSNYGGQDTTLHIEWLHVVSPEAAPEVRHANRFTATTRPTH